MVDDQLWDLIAPLIPRHHGLEVPVAVRGSITGPIWRAFSLRFTGGGVRAPLFLRIRQLSVFTFWVESFILLSPLSQGVHRSASEEGLDVLHGMGEVGPVVA